MRTNLTTEIRMSPV